MLSEWLFNINQPLTLHSKKKKFQEPYDVKQYAGYN